MESEMESENAEQIEIAKKIIVVVKEIEDGTQKSIESLEFAYSDCQGVIIPHKIIFA
jgi:hypothetical protein